MKLIGNRVLAEKIISENKSTSGIILGPTADLNAHRARVIIVGPDEVNTKVGDIVKYDHNSAIEQEVDGKDCVFLRGGETGNILFKV